MLRFTRLTFVDWQLPLAQFLTRGVPGWQLTVRKQNSEARRCGTRGAPEVLDFTLFMSSVQVAGVEGAADVPEVAVVELEAVADVPAEVEAAGAVDEAAGVAPVAEALAGVPGEEALAAVSQDVAAAWGERRP
jgi:hypothetical protein